QPEREPEQRRLPARGARLARPRAAPPRLGRYFPAPVRRAGSLHVVELPPRRARAEHRLEARLLRRELRARRARSAREAPAPGARLRSLPGRARAAGLSRGRA